MTVRTRWIAALATAALACLMPAAPAAASGGHAEAVLAEAEALLAADPAPEPSEELTGVLAELAAVTSQLEGSDRDTARAILARPEDPDDRYGDSYTVDDESECSANFCVHWVETTPDAPDLDDDNGTDDGDGVPDVVEEALASAEDSFAVENTALGWAEPLSDGARGGGGPGLTDVYLLETGGAYFGYASPDEGQGGAVSRYAYLVLDEDMAEFVDAQLTALEALQATMAHEYNHVLQFTYDSKDFVPNLWMLESTATWMEEQVYPAINDYLRYVPSFASTTTTPLTQGGRRIYGAALWNHYLESTDGDAVIRAAWEDLDTVTPAHLGVAAYDSALGGDGASPFDRGRRELRGFRSRERRVASAARDRSPTRPALPDVAREGKLTPATRPEDLARPSCPRPDEGAARGSPPTAWS